MCLHIHGLHFIIDVNIYKGRFYIEVQVTHFVPYDLRKYGCHYTLSMQCVVSFILDFLAHHEEDI